ncbi:MAG: hypothetical protein JXX29_21390 [Deltaproteobacteria bacterium]|nr:hypothetical protein [Deltaproteobacteria bacterium]MBN2674251.1 hypothetical protein [Deltaproteobacteria bacterium]
MILFIRILLAGTFLCLCGCSDGVLHAAQSAQDTNDSSSAIIDSATETESTPPTDVSTETETQTDPDTATDSDPTLYQIMGEAEAFFESISTNSHQWVLINDQYDGSVVPDADTDHLADAGGGAYLEALPDNHTSDADTAGSSTVNPTNAPQVRYNISVPAPGRYYVWVRAYTSGGLDNSLHVGIDSDWPESGIALQFPNTSGTWVWSSNQRNSGGIVYGIPNTIYLDIETAGAHSFIIAMREDGAEIDRWILSNDLEFRPE